MTAMPLSIDRAMRNLSHSLSRDPAHDDTPLRLALFTDTFTPQINGVVRTLERMIGAIRERGGDVQTFTTSDPHAAADTGVSRYESVPFWAYPDLRIAVPRLASVLRDLGDYRPTLVHAATPFGVGVIGRSAATRLGVPFITSYHTSFSAYAKYYHLGALATLGWSYLRRFHNSGVRTYTPSNAITDELATRGFTNLAVWDRGVDTGAFHPTFRNDALRSALGVRDDTVVVGYVGRIAREKGIDTILDAIPHVVRRARTPVQFVFVGDGPYERACRARHLPNTSFLGRHIARALSELYASMDIFLFPSITDTFGNVLLEAAASRLAVIAADAPPTREVVGDAASLVPPSDPIALADEIVRMVDDPEARERLANAAFARARTRSWNAVFDTLIADYRAIINRPPGGRTSPPPLTLST